MWFRRELYLWYNFFPIEFYILVVEKANKGKEIKRNGFISKRLFANFF